ncbi:DUF45 domain-containing protein [Micromonospora sp. C51]|uniref:M48 family metallopeptidase n=1 Tax=Micromonospora sp. C51 TaxID=2824879 RepID=UPI001B374E00|nr:SprT-like domain-containing protein [Micromonospora sp. C51]MBQ1048478.1 DUF45 domain-containing protein [Micromonospora sp. C51]
MRTIADFRRAATPGSRWLCINYRYPNVSGLRTITGGKSVLAYSGAQVDGTTFDNGRLEFPKTSECRIEGNSLHYLGRLGPGGVDWTWTLIPDGSGDDAARLPRFFVARPVSRLLRGTNEMPWCVYDTARAAVANAGGPNAKDNGLGAYFPSEADAHAWVAKHTSTGAAGGPSPQAQACPNGHGPMALRRGPQTPEQRACGTWYDCAQCKSSLLVPSPELRDQLDAQAAKADPAAPYTAAVKALDLPAEWFWTVVVRQRKAIGATVKAGGSIVFRVPPAATPEQLARFVRANRPKLGQMVAKMTGYSAAPPVKELVNGEGFLWLGRNHKLRIADPGPQRCCPYCKQEVVRDPAVPVLAQRRHAAGLSSGPSFELSVLRDSLSRKAIVRWYIQRGQAWVDEHAPAWIQRMGVADGLRIVVRDLGKRTWGRYVRAGHLIELDWTLFQLERQHVESVLVHELAHATRPGGKPHGPAWRRVMDRAMFDWPDRAKRMEEAGHHVWQGDVAGPKARPVEPAPAPVAGPATETRRELPAPGETDPAVRWRFLGQISSGAGGPEHRARWARYVAAIRRVHGLADGATHDELIAARNADGRSWAEKCTAYWHMYAHLMFEEGAARTAAAEPYPARLDPERSAADVGAGPALDPWEQLVQLALTFPAQVAQ